MKTINLAKAESITGTVESITIVIDRKITGDEQESLIIWEAFCEEQAKMFCDAVLNALPQGVTDRIYRELTGRKASLFQFSQEQYLKHLRA